MASATGSTEDAAGDLVAGEDYTSVIPAIRSIRLTHERRDCQFVEAAAARAAAPYSSRAAAFCGAGLSSEAVRPQQTVPPRRAEDLLGDGRHDARCREKVYHGEGAG